MFILFFKIDASQTHYDVLGINQNATKKQIAKAYKNKALLHHPDKNLNNKAEAEAKFKK